MPVVAHAEQNHVEAGDLVFAQIEFLAQGLLVVLGSPDRLKVAAHVDVYFGQVLPEVADRVRTAIADAVASQVGVEVSSVDVYVDGIQFAE